MPVNPFQATAEMSWGGYQSMKPSQGAVGGRLGGGLDRGNRTSTNMGQAYTKGELKPTPKASGRMPEGNANIGRPNYGQQQQQQPQQRASRLSKFGGMGDGSTKGGSGMTAGGDIKFDLSVGKTDYRGADMTGARIGASGMGAKTSDSNLGDINQSQNYSPQVMGAKAGSSRGGAGGEGKSSTGSGRGGAGGNAARGGDAGDTLSDMSGVKFGSPTVQIGRNKSVGRDDMSDNRKTSTRTKNVDARKPLPVKEGPASKKPDPAKPAAETEKPTSKTPTKPATKETEPKSPSKPAAKETPSAKKPKKETPAKEDPKAESKKKDEIKESAAKSVEDSVKKGPAAGAKPKAKPKTKTKKAGGVTKEEDE